MIYKGEALDPLGHCVFVTSERKEDWESKKLVKIADRAGCSRSESGWKLTCANGDTHTHSLTQKVHTYIFYSSFPSFEQLLKTSKLASDLIK